MKNVEKLALAALLHDIGKFAQRAEVPLREPFEKNRYGHKHAAYTHQVLAEFFNDIQNYHQAAYEHHLVNENSNEESWIIAAADRLASGFEREHFEEYNENVEKEILTSFKEQRLDHLFCNEKKFPLSRLQPNSLFSDFEKEEGYETLWQEFLEDLKLLSHKENFPLPLKIDSLEYLLRKYGSFIPSATSFRSKYSDTITKASIPLAEHLKSTAIFASTIAAMNDENRRAVINYYRKRDDSLKTNTVFLLVNGDFFGIQQFIFDEVQAKFAAKTLRAKSAFVQILVRVLAYYVTEKLGLSRHSIISTHAGKFEILAPYDEAIIGQLEELQKEFNEHFIQTFFGQTGMGLAWQEASIEDFIDTRKYREFRQKLADRVEEVKFHKFDLLEKGAVVFEIDPDLDNQNLCDFCHKRKGRKKEEYVICKECEKFVKIGQSLANPNLKYIAISKKSKGEGDVEIYKGYFLHFFENPSKELAKEDIAIFDISKDQTFSGFAKWELASYVATEDERILTLEELAERSVQEGDPHEGVKAIMTLKADVDGMGDFIKNSNVTNSFAKYNFFARIIDYFFSVNVPHLMQKKFPNTYTVFAGGDDLFILGAWDEVLALAKKVRKEFVRFTCCKLTISCGLVMTKPNKPINFIAHEAETALEKAKDHEQNGKAKDALTLFGETVKWDDYLKNLRLFEELQKNKPSAGFLYRLLELCEMSKNVKEDLRNTIWKSKLAYLFRRNIDNPTPHFFQTIDEMIDNYPKEAKMKIVEYLYRRRHHA